MPDELEIRWLKRALANLEEAEAKYIARDNPAAAARTIKKVVTAVERLRRLPASGRAGRVEGTRELIVSGTPYVIPYRVRHEEIQILRVLHAARKWPPC